MADAASPWLVVQLAAVALLVALVLPYLLPRGRRHRGMAARISLALALGLALAGAGAMTGEMEAPGNLLRLAAMLAFVCGVIGLVGLVLFELVLPPLRVDVPSIVRDVIQLLVAALAILACLRIAGFDVLPLLTTSAVLTAIIGLALQATIANLFGGLALQLDRTLVQGDWIETGTHSGRIVEIGWRSTRLITRDGDTLFLPNSQLVSGEVLNLSRPTGAHRAEVRVSVHERYAPMTVRQTFVNAIRDLPGVLPYPPPDCLVSELGDQAIVYTVRYWISEFERDGSIASDVRTRLWYAGRRAGLDTVPHLYGLAVAAAEGDERASVPSDTPAARVALLRAAELFAPLDDAACECLARHMRRLEFTTGEPIVQQGADGDALYVVQHGRIGVRVQVDGSVADVATLGPGDIFGEMSALTGAPRAATCTARSETTCYAIDRAAFEEVLAARPAIAEHFGATLARRQTQLDAQREGLSAANRARREVDRSSQLLGRIRELFGIT
jgi:small-conductance mechanosensitive channel/CRP-like cAMP-binding protein